MFEYFKLVIEKRHWI